MRRFAIESVLIGLLVYLLLDTTDAEMLIPVQVVPHGIESVNGSDSNMGCTSPLVDGCSGVTFCDNTLKSYLVDGDTPAINTSTSDWASKLVTVRKTQTDEITFDHVLLTFSFDTAVTLTGIELDLFLCPDMKIGAPYITVYASDKSKLVSTYELLTGLTFRNYTPIQLSCDSLSTVNIVLRDTIATAPYLTWYILISQFSSSIDWVYVGEVRFLGMDVVVPSDLDAEVLIPVEIVVPQGIESVNGSDINMGCTSPLVNDSDGVMVCMSQSYLVDGCSPAIDTSTSDWASQLVTMIESRKIDGHVYRSHVVLTFGFESIVAVTSVEIDLFYCPEWNIGVPNIHIDLYAGDEDRGLKFHVSSSTFRGSVRISSSQTSCTSLSTVLIPIQSLTFRSKWHILMPSPSHSPVSNDIDWVHIGEIRFMGSSNPPNTSTIALPTPTPTPSGDDAISTSIISSSRLVTSFDVKISPTKSSSPFSTSITTSYVSSYPSVTVATSFLGGTNLSKSRISSSASSMSSSLSVGVSSSLSVGVSSSLSVGVSSSTFSSVTLSSVNVTLSTVTPKMIPLQYMIIAGVGGLIALIFVLIIIVCCCITVRYRSRKQQKVNLHANNYTTSISNETSITNGRSLSATSPLTTYALTVGNGLYETIPGETQRNSLMIPNVAVDNTQTTIISDSNEWIGLYDVVTETATDATERREPITTGLETTSQIPIRLDSAVNGPDTVCVESATNGADAATGTTAADGGSDGLDPDDLYIDMKKSQSNLLSPDLEQCLIRRYTINDGIYSERIDPSHFTHSAPRAPLNSEAEQDLEFYPPVYPALAYPPQGFKQTMEVSGENIKEMKQLRMGQFGKTVLATTVGLSLKAIGLSKTDDNENISIRVAVKKLCPHPSRFTYEQEALFKETKFMSQLKHPNVLRLLGVCYNNPLFMMMEYTDEGDLNQFLQRCSEIVPIKTPSSNNQITTSTLIYIAYQIANAMKYLAGYNFVHRDLATRNCFIETNTVVKVGDLGVNMKYYRPHYFMIQGNTLLPIRWMAPECFNGTFSEKSDVWAFGVTMWEMFTLAKQVPNSHLSDEEVIQNTLQRENCQFPSKPAACPQGVYEIIELCRVIDMNQRATFTDLHKMLQNHV